MTPTKFLNQIVKSSFELDKGEEVENYAEYIAKSDLFVRYNVTNNIFYEGYHKALMGVFVLNLCSLTSDNDLIAEGILRFEELSDTKCGYNV